MGLKSGSRDAELDDGEDDAVEEEPADEQAPAEPEGSAPPDSDPDPTVAVEDDGGSEGDGGSKHPSMAAIPYKLRRDKVNEGREQVPFFLREAVIDGEDELQEALEDALGEDVYKSDYREAAMVVAQRNPELVADVLREWGYDLDA